MKTNILLAGAALLALGISHSRGAGIADIQAALDKAQPGDVVAMPAGVYEGTLKLAPGVALVGEGADVTILDAQGADLAVAAAKDSLVVGLTIRNAGFGVHNQANFIGVFESAFQNCSKAAVRMEHGSGVIVHNWIAKSAYGVQCLEANPYIGSNLIEENNVGVLVWHYYVPTLEANLFRRNQTAVMAKDGGRAILLRNVFDQNARHVDGLELGETDEVRALTEDELKLHRGGAVEQYRELMRAVHDKAVEVHPVVIYDLGNPAVDFKVITCFPWATFSVASSSKATALTQYDAYDRRTDLDLAARPYVLNSGQPGVAVENPALIEKQLDRYVLTQLYQDAGSYFFATDGTLRFKRGTNLSRIEILLPYGFVAGTVNYPAASDVHDGRQVVKIIDVGWTELDLTLTPGTP